MSVATAISLVLAELGLRLALGRSLRVQTRTGPLRALDPILGWKYLARTTLRIEHPDYSVELRTNSRGFRDAERATPKRAGVMRVAILGDSFVAGIQVAQAERFSERLEVLLGRSREVEVVNLGIGGYSTAQELLAYRQEGIRLQPDVVILAVCTLNDATNNSRALSTGSIASHQFLPLARPYPDGEDPAHEPLRVERRTYTEARARKDAEARRRSSEGLLAQRWRTSTLRRTIQHLNSPPLGRSDPNVRYGAYLDHFDPRHPSAVFPPQLYSLEWPRAWAWTRRLIETIASEVEAEGATFVLVHAPQRIECVPEAQERVRSRYPTLSFDFSKPSRFLAELSLENRMHYLSPQDQFEELGASAFFRSDFHWTPLGHSAMAEALAKYLDSSGILSAVPPRPQ